MATIAGTKVIARIVPTDTADTYATHDDEFGAGGLRTDVADTTERDAIPVDRRKKGMIVYVVTDNHYYKLEDDLTTWTDKGILADITVINPATRNLYNANGDTVFNWNDNLQTSYNIYPNNEITTKTIRSYSINIDPLVSSPNYRTNLHELNLNVDPNNSGFATNDVTMQHINLQHLSTSVINNATLHNLGGNFGGGVAGEASYVTGININNNFNANYSLGNYTGINVGGNFDTNSQFIGNANVVQITSNPVYRSTGIKNIHGTDMYAQIYCDVNQGVNVYNASYNMYGSASYWVDAQLGSNFRNGSTVADIKSLNVTPFIEPSANVTTLTLGNFSLNANPVTATNEILGVVVNLDNSTVTGGNKRAQAWKASGGFLNTFFITKSEPGLFFDGIHSVVTYFTIDAGSPITNTEIVINNNTALMVLSDDYTNGPLGFGIINTIAGGQLSVASGKTIETLSDFVAGGSVPAQVGDGGTIQHKYSYRASGLLSFGGNLTIQNFYAFDMPATATADYTPTVGAWGIHIADANAENWLKKSLVVGGTTGKVTDVGYAIEIADKKAFKWTPMTTAERDALFPTPAEGTEIYNSTTHTKQYWNGTAWV